jgi:precorrin-6x reductase
MIDTKEAAARLGMSRRRVLEFIGQNRLPAIRQETPRYPGHRYWIEPEKLAAVVDLPMGRHRIVAEEPGRAALLEQQRTRMATLRAQRRLKREVLRIVQADAARI